MELQNVKIINYNQVLNNADLIIEEGVITKIIPKQGQGTKIVIPGFIDIHSHGFRGNTFADGFEAAQQIIHDLGTFGVTSIVATVMTRQLEILTGQLKAMAHACQQNPRIVGIHCEGPFIALAKKGAHNPAQILPGKIKYLTKLITAAQGHLLKMTFAPEVVERDFIPLLVKNNVIPSIGHSAATAKQTLEAINQGACHGTHLWNAMTGVVNRNPGVVEALLNEKRVYVELICDFIHVDPETIKLTLQTKGPERIILVTDSIRPAGLPDGPSVSGGLKVEKHGFKITLAQSDNIAGSGITMLNNFHHILKMGVSLEAAVAMTSTNAAQSLGLKHKGQIQVGFDGDLIILDHDYKIIQVYAKGQKLRSDEDGTY